MNKWIKNKNIILLNMQEVVVCVDIILERTDVPRTCAVVIVRVQVKASDLTGHLTASFIGRQIVEP